MNVLAVYKVVTISTCSTCLKTDNNKLTKVTELDYDGISYLDKLRSFLGPEMEIDTSDVIQMCQNCVKNLASSNKFRETVVQSLQGTKCFDDLLLESNTELSIPVEHEVKTEPDEIEIKPHEIKTETADSNKKHRKDSPKTQRSYDCVYCGQIFKTGFHLREHVTIHTGNKEFNCPHCEKKFPRLSSLKRHTKSHYAPPGQKTRKTPFLCTICGKSFPFSNGAARHMRIHFGVRTHECEVCNKKFSQSTHLRVHMRTHSGEKPYICENCGESFTLKAGLHKHLRNIHKAKEESVDSEDIKDLFKSEDIMY